MLFSMLINWRGGHCPFDKNEKNFLEIRDEPPTREECFPKNAEEFLLGWISPEGDTYSCGYEGHMHCADMICEENNVDVWNAERELENRGWVKITKAVYDRERERDIYVKDYVITKKQADKLFDLGLYSDRQVKRLVKNSEKNW